MTRPSPPPEADLIRLARLARRLRVAEAAARAGISRPRWIQVESGYYTREGSYVPTTAPDDALAAMAQAVGVTPEDLDGTGRAGAANVLRLRLQMQAREGGNGSPIQGNVPDLVRQVAETFGVDPGQLWDDDRVQDWAGRDVPDKDKRQVIGLIASTMTRSSRSPGD